MLERRLHLSIFASHHMLDSQHVVMLHHLEAVLLFQQFSLIHTSSSEWRCGSTRRWTMCFNQIFTSPATRQVNITSMEVCSWGNQSRNDWKWWPPIKKSNRSGFFQRTAPTFLSTPTLTLWLWLLFVLPYLFLPFFLDFKRLENAQLGETIKGRR